MNPSRQRLALYVSLAFLSVLTVEIADAKQFADLSPLEWIKVLLSGAASSLVAWRAYIDQHAARADAATKENHP